MKQATTRASVLYLQDAIVDARLQIEKLKTYLDKANRLISQSKHRDHFWEVAGDILEGIPETLLALDRSLAQAALVSDAWNDDEIQKELPVEDYKRLINDSPSPRIRRIRHSRRRATWGKRQAMRSMPIAKKAFLLVVLPKLNAEFRKVFLKALDPILDRYEPLSTNFDHFQKTRIWQKIRRYKPLGEDPESFAADVYQAFFDWEKEVLKEAGSTRIASFGNLAAQRAFDEIFRPQLMKMLDQVLAQVTKKPMQVVLTTLSKIRRGLFTDPEDSMIFSVLGYVEPEDYDVLLLGIKDLLVDWRSRVRERGVA